MLARITQALHDEDGAVTVDWVTLAAAVVGIGIAAAASVRSGVTALSGDIQSSLSSASVVSLGMVGNVAGMVGGDWLIATVSNGVVGAYSTPWTFEQDGTVRHDGRWTGTWTQRSDGTLDVSITHNGGGSDAFSVTMNPDGSGFTAYQNGQVFRSAIRP